MDSRSPRVRVLELLPAAAGRQQPLGWSGPAASQCKAMLCPMRSQG